VRRLAALFLLASAAFAAAAPRLEFVKKFPNSTPAWFEVWIDRTGQGEYKEDPNDEQPFALRLDPAETETIFGLAERLGYFSKPVESGLKVAFMGEKTFRFLDGDLKRQTTFNYTILPEAQKLLDWFERIGETARHAINLDRTARFDRLGLDRALLELQYAYEQKRLAGAGQLLPILDRIARNKSAFNRVRERAAVLAEALRTGASPAP